MPPKGQCWQVMLEMRIVRISDRTVCAECWILPWNFAHCVVGVLFEDDQHYRTVCLGLLLGTTLR
jgi:hypothetical protein